MRFPSKRPRAAGNPALLLADVVWRLCPRLLVQLPTSVLRSSGTRTGKLECALPS